MPSTQKKKYYQREFTFSAEDIDLTSEFIEETLAAFDLPGKDVLRTRLSLEEILLNWRDKEGLGESYTVEISRRLGRISLAVRCQGAPCDPMATDSDESFGTGQLGQAMLENLGLSPSWQYRNGCNVVSCSLKKKRKLSQIKVILIAVVAALALGGAGLLLPQDSRNSILTTLLDPLFNTFLSAFSCIVGPMMFLSMVWGIINIGDPRQLGVIGKKLMSRFFLISTLCGIVSTLVALPVFGFKLSDTQNGQGVLQSVIKMVLDIIPGNIVEPFSSGNALQILFLGAVVGIVMILLRDRMQVLTQVVEQANAVVQLVLGVISSLTPVFIFISVLRLIMQGTLAKSAAGLLKLILLSIALSAVEVVVETLSLMKVGLSPVQAVKKLSATFIVGLTTASSAATLPTMIDSSKKKFGVDEKLANFALPFGSVVFMPHVVNLFVVIALFTAQVYGVELTIGSIVLCVLNSVILSVAAPPIPGGTISCYTLMFLQLGVPLEAISLAVAATVVLDFPATAGQLNALLVQLVHGAKKLGMLDEKILHSRAESAKRSVRSKSKQ